MTEQSSKQLGDATKSELNRAFAECAAIVRKSAGNFYYAFIILPPEKRRGIEALYAFCRVGDDLADDAGSDDSDRFAWLRRRLDICFDGRYCDETTLALSHSIQWFDFERQPFEDLIAGLESDLTVRSYSTFEELRLYRYRVAATVGLICLKIFGCDNPRTRRYAELHGIGMQLINILRDIKEDLERGRVYLPEEDMRLFDLDMRTLFADQNSQRLDGLIRFEAARAVKFLDDARALLQPEDVSPLIVARIMGALYRRILEKILAEERHDRRIELPTWEKLTVARKALGL